MTHDGDPALSTDPSASALSRLTPWTQVLTLQLLLDSILRAVKLQDSCVVSNQDRSTFNRN